jgi:hypothetical protein
MNFQSVNVMYYPIPHSDLVVIAYRRLGDETLEVDLPAGCGEDSRMTRAHLIEKFTAAQWEVETPDDGESITFARLVAHTGLVVWPAKKLRHFQKQIRPTDIHYLDEMDARTVTVLKLNMSKVTVRPDPNEALAPIPTQQFYPHQRGVTIWHTERVELDADTLTVTDYGWPEVFLQHVYTPEMTPPKNDE